MADKKISACAALTAPASGDTLPVLDVSESADADKNKKITLATLLNKTHSGSNGSPTLGWTDDAGTTGIYRSAEDEVGFTCNSVFKGAFTTSGLKLGTGTEAAQLHLFSTDTTDQIIIENSDGGVDTAPDLVLYRNSASPAANDGLGLLEFRGEDSAGNTHAYGQITSTIIDPSNTSEDGYLDFLTSSGGTIASRLRLYSQHAGFHTATPNYPLHVSASVTGTCLQLECDANDAASGADITLFHRRGASAASQDNDILASVFFRGKNDNSTPVATDFAVVEGKVIDASDTTEDGELNLKVQKAGTMTTQLSIGADASTFSNSVTLSEGGTIADAKNIALNTTTGTKIGTATGQKLGFWNVTPVIQPSAIANITTTASSGTLPTPDGSVTISDAASPTNAELLEYCTELESKLESALAALRSVGIIAT
jgi:hypothetical protein